MSASPNRTSFWRRTFEAARRIDGWSRVDKLYTRNTAAQVASDIRRAHLESRVTIRTNGIEPGEVWETRWNAVDNGANGDCEVWIRLRRESS
ncbi:MAG: hypothetical protein RIS41_1025 [Actinomycetota bacterium]|jgi:hypothetical protein